MTNLYYIPSKDVYLSSDGILYTDEELDHFAKLEREWKNDLHDLLPRSIVDWLKAIPQATKVARKKVKENIKEYKQELRSIYEQKQTYYDLWIGPASFMDQEEIQKDSDAEFELRTKNVESKIKTSMFTLSYINEVEGKEEVIKTSGFSEEDILKAKEVQIEDIFGGKLKKHGKLAVGECPFHSEKNPSFTVYLDQNSFWCYSCQQGGSVVDFVMKRDGVDFLSAIKTLLK